VEKRGEKETRRAISVITRKEGVSEKGGEGGGKGGGERVGHHLLFVRFSGGRKRG